DVTHHRTRIAAQLFSWGGGGLGLGEFIHGNTRGDCRPRHLEPQRLKYPHPSPLPSRGRGNGEACAVRYSVSRCGTSQYPSPPRGEGKGSRLLVAPTSSPLSSLYPQAPAQSVELLPADA